jgi:hypothetical protein
MISGLPFPLDLFACPDERQADGYERDADEEHPWNPEKKVHASLQ